MTQLRLAISRAWCRMSFLKSVVRIVGEPSSKAAFQLQQICTIVDASFKRSRRGEEAEVIRKTPSVASQCADGSILARVCTDYLVLALAHLFLAFLSSSGHRPSLSSPGHPRRSLSPSRESISRLERSHAHRRLAPFSCAPNLPVRLSVHAARSQV